METPVKTFTAKYTDEFGAVFPAAIVSIKEFTEKFQRTGRSEDCIENYKIELETSGIAWEGRFWVDEERKSQGYRSRAIVINKDHVFDKIVDVDVEREEVESVLAGNLPHEDKVLHVIKLDFLHRFTQ